MYRQKTADFRDEFPSYSLEQADESILKGENETYINIVL